MRAELACMIHKYCRALVARSYVLLCTPGKYSLHVLMQLVLLLLIPLAASATDYLYQRDVNIPAYQTLREFFDMPNRPGHYAVTLISDAIGPLTFRLIRVHDEKEHTIKHTRSYHLKSHEFETAFDNPKGEYDLIVEMTNSNPAVGAKVSVFVVELASDSP